MVVLYAYAKLLIMDATISSILDEKEQEELQAVRQTFEKKNVDCKLIKMGAPLVISLLSNSYRLVFRTTLLNKYGDLNLSSDQIIDCAFESAPADFIKACACGNGIDDIIEYQKEIKRINDSLGEDTGCEEHITTDEKPDTQDDLADQVLESLGITGDETDEEIEALCDSLLDDTALKYRIEDQTVTEQKNFSDISERYRSLQESLLDVVKGQDSAVLKFIRGCFRGELLSRRGDKGTPVAYFFFFGPPGVGKTFLAETAAEHQGRPSKIFNMSEFSSDVSYEQLVGFSSTYKNSQPGILTEFVKKNPNALLVFDEIEKAHIGVIRQFLQILGSGNLTDAYTKKTVSFKDTIIIFTSNVGKDLYADRSVKLSGLPERVILDAIASEKDPYGDTVMPPEICSRIASGNLIIFDHLSIRQLVKMVKENYEKVVEQMKEEYGCAIMYNSALPMLFLHNRGGEIDARIATYQSANFLKDELFELTCQLENVKETNIKSIHFDIEWDRVSDELKRLFKNTGKTEVLVLAEDDVVDYFPSSQNQYVMHHAKTLEEARELLKHDISAAFIDPRFRADKDSDQILSISDYISVGNDFFKELVRVQAGLPVFILEINETFSEVDQRTFMQEGAEGTIRLLKTEPEAFSREFERLMEELYMERENLAFSQKGWIIDFGTKQIISDDGERAEIIFYDLRKTMAVDMESRDTVLKEAERPKIRFSDVIGAKKAKEELQYFINYLKNPKQFLIEGGKPPRGVLLYGPPGTGKTMLAKAMAGESDVVFIQTSASELKNPYVGVSEDNIRKLFKKARRYAPAIIFIDEIDAIGKKRTGGMNSSTTESMLNTLLTEMDGFATDNKKPVFVLAATNYGVQGESDGISALDEALIRRFDNKIYVDLPTEEERKVYINRMVESKNLSAISEQVKNNIAERTTGQSLAIIQNVIDLAYRNAVKEHKKVTDDTLLNALEEYLYGEKKEHDADYYRKVAIHEVGHAFVSYLCGDKPSYITIESRGEFGGYMQHANQEDIPEYTREDLIGRIRTCLAGRAAESVFFDQEKSLNTGASSDLEKATDYAWNIICRYGMEDDQLIVLDKKEVLNSPLAPDYVAKVNELLKKEMAATVKMIEDGRDKIRAVADVLVKKNKLTSEEFEILMEG